MALADFDAYREAILRPSWRSTHYKDWASEFTWISSLAVPFATIWEQVPFEGVVPTTAVVCDRTTAGGFPHPESAGRLIVTSAAATTQTAGVQFSGAPQDFSTLMIDRLNHQSGIVGNIITTQTTNLPTAALTRYTSGEGVYIGIQMYETFGSITAGGLISISYTNQAGTSGRTAVQLIATSSTYRQFGMMIPGLQVGDTGVRSVESVTFSAATTTAGNIGIVLFKPLFHMFMEANTVYNAESIPGWNTGIHSDACLQPLISYTLVSGCQILYALSMTDV